MVLTRSLLAAGAVVLLVAGTVPDTALAGDQPQGFGFHAVGADLGLVDAESRDMTVAFGGHAVIGAPFESAPQLVLVPRILYWSKSEGSGSNEISFSEFSVVVDGRYFFPVDSPLEVFAGGGLGFQRTSASGSDTDIGITFLGGVMAELGERLKGSAEFRIKFGGWDEWFLLFGGTYAITQ